MEYSQFFIEKPLFTNHEYNVIFTTMNEKTKNIPYGRALNCICNYKNNA